MAGAKDTLYIITEETYPRLYSKIIYDIVAIWEGMHLPLSSGIGTVEEEAFML